MLPVSRERRIRTRGLATVWWVLLLAFALLGLFIFYTHLSQELDTDVPPVNTTEELAEVEVMLDESYLALTLGDPEGALINLEELQSYCEMTGQEPPPEADELYDRALEEWLVFSSEGIP